jgi:putative flippase GtrA
VRALPGQLLRFGLVGVSNTLLTLAAFALLRAAGVSPAPAAALAFALGAANGYVLNSRWTFQVRAASAASAARYVLVQGAAAALDARLTVAFAHALGDPVLLAQCLALVPASVFAFTLTRWWAFRAPRATRRSWSSRLRRALLPSASG